MFRGEEYVLVQQRYTLGVLLWVIELTISLSLSRTHPPT